MSPAKTFVIETPEQRVKLLSYIGARDLPVLIEVGPVREQRSIPQNSRLWKLHALVAAQTGNSAEDMHEEALCRHFGYNEMKMPTGWIKRIPLKRSSAREKKEFHEFMESTEAWYATDFGVWLGQDD